MNNQPRSDPVCQQRQAASRGMDEEKIHLFDASIRGFKTHNVGKKDVFIAGNYYMINERFAQALNSIL